MKKFYRLALTFNGSKKLKNFNFDDLNECVNNANSLIGEEVIVNYPDGGYIAVETLDPKISFRSSSPRFLVQFSIDDDNSNPNPYNVRFSTLISSGALNASGYYDKNFNLVDSSASTSGGFGKSLPKYDHNKVSLNNSFSFNPKKDRLLNILGNENMGAILENVEEKISQVDFAQEFDPNTSFVPIRAVRNIFQRLVSSIHR